MYRSTAEFINARQKFCNWKLEVRSFRNQGERSPNKCYMNSREAKLNEDNVWMIAGWLIMPYNQKTNSTEIIQHWWNDKGHNEQFDTTDHCLEARPEYVQDLSYFSFCMDYDAKLTSHVSSSLLLRDGEFVAVDECSDGSIAHRKIANLSCEELFKTKMLR